MSAKNKTCELHFSQISSKTSKGKEILRNLSGQFNNGSLVAIMGTSGSGKTTLLNVLSGYNTQNATCATLEINGSPTDFECISKMSCYLTQDIHLNDLLTVEENMNFAAHFKLGVSQSQIQKNKIVGDILDSFGLSSTRNTRTGKLSGGERKRLAIALEMISDPQIIYLDEPTTGLDISATNQILRYLKMIANSGKTVICTIHQVCASHFKLFDYAYVISDGQCAYRGKPENLVPFLDRHGLPCNIYHNPADYIIELCSGDYGNDKSEYLITATENENTFEQTSKNSKKKLDFNKFDYSKASWLYQFKTLLWRENKKLYRNLILVPYRILGTNFVSLSLGLLFWNIGNDASKVLTNYNFGLAIVGSALLTGLLYPVLSFSSQMELVKREVYNKYYTIFQYYIAVVFTDLPISLTAIITSSMLGWYLSGQLLELERITVFLLFMILFGFLVNMVGFFFGTLNVPIGAGLLGCAATQCPMLVISGYGVQLPDVYWLFEYIGRFLYLRNALQGCLVAMLGMSPRDMECPEDELFCYYADPHRFLLNIGMDPYDYASCLYNVLFWLVFIMFLTYIMMRLRLS